MRCHPACGLPLQTILKLIIGFDIIVSAIAVNTAAMGIFVIQAYKFNLIENPGFALNALNVHMSTIVLFGIFLILDIMLDIWLWIVVSNNDRLKCQIWFLIKLVLEICDAIGFITEICSGLHTALYIVFMSLDFAFTCYFMWVLYAFIVELKKTFARVVGGTKFVTKFTADPENPQTFSIN